MGISEELDLDETNSRANPETCRHNVIQQFLTAKGDHGIICVSCDSTLDRAFHESRNYEYDIDYDVWVYVPLKK